jgi:hypothetical protein
MITLRDVEALSNLAGRIRAPADATNRCLFSA